MDALHYKYDLVWHKKWRAMLSKVAFMTCHVVMLQVTYAIFYI